jgi:hypothetical protein
MPTFGGLLGCLNQAIRLHNQAKGQMPPSGISNHGEAW